MLYGLSEEYVLHNYAIETINRKVRNGLSFDFLRRGLVTPAAAPDAPEEIDMYGVYYDG
jgi:hypothetical protein